MKEIHLHVYKTGRVRRYGYYEDLRAAACALALLNKAGWNSRAIKKLTMANKYYIHSDKVYGRIK